jgi:predicted nucleotidyltransferase
MSRGPDPRRAPLERAVDLLDERFRPLAIVLFGSRARGQEHEGSDHDLAILTGRPVPDALAAGQRSFHFGVNAARAFSTSLAVLAYIIRR